MGDDAVADAVMAAAAGGRSLRPFTEADPRFDLPRAYRVGAEIARRREAAGERIVGWKIGFTNTTIWDQYGVRAPIWAPVYDRTLVEVADPAAPAACGLAGIAEARIEPEIVLRLGRVPRPGADEGEILACVDRIAHGIEIVQSPYPGWRFAAPDTVAAFGLHARLFRGPWRPAGPGARGALETFRVALERDGVPVDEGAAADVLGGPLSACRRFLDGFAADGSFARGLAPGDLVTTGTVTRAFPVAPGERWTTRIAGLDLPGLTVAFA